VAGSKAAAIVDVKFIFPYILKPFGSLGAIWLLNSSLAFEASTDPVDTSAQAALAPQGSRRNRVIQISWQSEISVSSHCAVELWSWTALISCQVCIPVDRKIVRSTWIDMYLD
jgi:hypothetical protein